MLYTDLINFVEEYRLVVGKRFTNKFFAIGVDQGVEASASFVKFNHELVFEYEDNPRWDVIGFWHSHPNGSFPTPSARDSDTMHAWTTALGRPLLCAITYANVVHGWWFSVTDEPQYSVNRYGAGTIGKLPIIKFGKLFYGRCPKQHQ